MKKKPCPVSDDGRQKHYFVKKVGEFTCVHCGTMSNRMQRWELAPMPVAEAAV